MKRFNLLSILAGITFMAFSVISVNASEVPAAAHKAATSKKASRNPANKSPKVKNTFETPDFAFPREVESNAEKRLKLSLDKRDGAEALKALMQMSVSSLLISDDCLPDMLSKCSETAVRLPAPWNALIHLYMAGMLNEKYQGQSWIYDRRIIPSDSVPPNIDGWSRDMFADSICSLVSMARKEAVEAYAAPISDIAGVLSGAELFERGGLTTGDFILMKSCGYLSDFVDPDGNESDVIPFTPTGPLSPSEPTPSALLEEIKSALYSSASSGADRRRAIIAAWLAAAISNADKCSQFVLNELVHVAHTPYRIYLLDILFDRNSGYFTFSDNPREGHVATSVSLPSHADFYADLKSLSKETDKSIREVADYMMSMIDAQRISLDIPGSLLPGKETPLEIKGANVRNAEILVYRVSDSYLGKVIRHDTLIKTGKLAATVPVVNPGEIPFSFSTDCILPGLSPGVYVAIMKVPGAYGKNDTAHTWHSTFIVSSLAMMEISVPESDTSNVNKENDFRMDLVVADALNFAPVEGAQVSLYRKNNNVNEILLGKGLSNAEGVFSLQDRSDPTDRYYWREYIAKASKDDFLSCIDFSSSRSYSHKDEESVHGKIYTDISVYHPGDTVRFSGMFYTASSCNASLLAESRIVLKLFDTNNECKDTLHLTTDRWGRLEGEFKLPESGLLGSYRISAEREKDNGAPRPYGDGYMASAFFEVAEYQAPSFYVTLEGGDKTFNAGDTLEFKGAARTWSGMPVAGAKVNYTVDYRPFWFRYWDDGKTATYGGSVSAGMDGGFVIALPTANLKGTRYEQGNFTIRVTAVSPAGESQESAPLTFSLGEGKTINPAIPEKIEASSDTLKFNVPVYNSLNVPLITEVNYDVVDEKGKIIKSGEFVSPLLQLPAASLLSGKYTFKFRLKENCGASGAPSPEVASSVVIWRENDGRPPLSQCALWIPSDRIIANKGASDVSITIGSTYPDSHILCVAENSNGEVSRRWVIADNCNLKVSFPAPKDTERLKVSFFTMREYDMAYADVTVVPYVQTVALECKTITFRDRIVPGAEEKWQFRFAMDSQPVAGLPAMAVMTDKAIDKIAMFNWSVPDFTPGFYFPVRFTRFPNDYYSVAGNWRRRIKYRNLDVRCPEWKYQGAAYGARYDSSSRSYLTGAVMESVSDELADNSEILGSYAPTELKMSRKNAAMKMEEAEEDAPLPLDNGSGSDKDDVPLRDMEMPVAFFHPMLNADRDGVVTLDFTVPDFNTTWKLQLLGYDAMLHGAKATLETTAAKEVMVQSNVPRFLRYGDRAGFVSTLYNNSAGEMPVGGKIEIFDPFSGRILLSRSFDAETLRPSGSRVISVEWRVPSDMTAVGYRAYAYGGNSSDGEQQLIPVLPSSTPVYESSSFYMAPGVGDFTMKLPKYDAEANVTLQYCDNPVWYCLTALPDMMNPSSDNALTLVDALYSNALASGLVRQYPQIRQALERIEADRDASKSLLTSNLLKNPDLKIVDISSTPWIGDAQSETLRMSRLTDLLDVEASCLVIKSLIDKLRALQTPEGGWTWTPGMPPSRFITSRVLLWLGMMNRFGCVDYPEDLDIMSRKAIAWTEGEIVKDYNRHPKTFSPESLLNYLYVRSNFPAVTTVTPGFASLREKGLKEIATGWKGYGIYEKATAATLLWRSGMKDVAGEILESLAQFASESDSKGVWFDNIRSGYSGWNKLVTTSQVLEAYAEIDPSSPMVDGLRQWLVLSRQTEDWGANRFTSEVIAAILSSGSSWTDSSRVPEIFVGNRKIQLPDGGMLTGEFTLSLSPKEASGKELRIGKYSAGPSWGGVIQRYVAPISEVKPSSVEDLSIVKSIYAVASSENGTNAVGSQLKVGDKVRVTLTVNCGKDMEYVVITDDRPACLEPADQLSGYTAGDGVWYYLETRNASTNLFIPFLPKGDFVISYECYVTQAGDYADGIATVQSQYAPVQTAHSSGRLLQVR